MARKKRLIARRGVELEIFESARDVAPYGLPDRRGVARLQRGDDRIVLAHEARNVAWAAPECRARDLLVIAEAPVGLRERPIAGERHNLDVEALVERDERAEGLERRAVSAPLDQAVDRLQIVERLSVPAVQGELRRPHLDDEAGLKEASEVVSRRAQSDSISLISPEGDEPLRVQPRQRFAHRNEARPEAPRKTVDNDALALGELAVGNQPMQFVMREVDQAAHAGGRRRRGIGGVQDRLLKNRLIVK